MSARDKLAMVVSPALLGILDEYVGERVREELAAQASRTDGQRWLTVREAAQLEGCSADAMRMRLARGRYDSKRVGRTVLVSAASLNGGSVATSRGRGVECGSA